ncbi:MAG TPA: tyrosine--tRNA ligase [Candidatus Saccharimonadales bacterium]|nr:tyrosine--tRNA ligase [Candidatus Saccharimonadales bacterium]
MTLSEELTWRGFVNQTTYKDLNVLDGDPITFYWGVDPSADSMTVGHLAMAMMIKQFMKRGHKPILLVGGATGLIGDPDGKAQERDLKTPEEVGKNVDGIVGQYHRIFEGQDLQIVNNIDWFRDFGYLDFLRDVGKHVPMRQMLGRDFVQTRLGEEGAGISYAEFSYVLIQAYDFLYLHEKHGVTLQVAGSDQWGNSIAGVDLIRRKTGAETNVYTAPLIINKSTGVKFGKSEVGAVWLDPAKTTPTQFYQFWINCDDEGVEDYLKVYTELAKEEIEQIMAAHRENPGQRSAQTRLAEEVTTLVHGEDQMKVAENVTNYLTGKTHVGDADGDALEAVRKEIPAVTVSEAASIIETLARSGLASSNTEARRFLSENAVSINGQRVTRENFEASDFQNGRLLLRRGKAFKDSALVELG